jgi:hypothetical protein
LQHDRPIKQQGISDAAVRVKGGISQRNNVAPKLIKHF